ncbi:maleylpyruvate isomerase family mycothiol-dependent enzyme [Streptosporangiaceae bacterium NEAU-GS5]|nr:maleylpyruvate isomerase family mycothiol-dependent enzyme [Streptosporangiaceae bacterium NEAU-GS5]
MTDVERLYRDALGEVAPMRSPALLEAARARRRPAVAARPWIAPYAGRIAAMDALLAQADDWTQVIVEGWTLHELIAHLAAKDGLVARAVGAPVLGPPVERDDALERTASLQEFELARSPQETRRAWRDQADALCAHLADVDPETVADAMGTPIPVRDHLLGRMLETWIHTDDAATFNGVRLPHPVPEHIHPTADFCARLIPWTMLLSGLDRSDRAVRITLTGPGGGDWHVPLDAAHPAVPYRGEASDAAITADVVEFCFLLGGRGTPAFHAEGDPGLVEEVIAAAPALSGP